LAELKKVETAMEGKKGRLGEPFRGSSERVEKKGQRAMDGEMETARREN